MTRMASSNAPWRLEPTAASTRSVITKHRGEFTGKAASSTRSATCGWSATGPRWGHTTCGNAATCPPRAGERAFGQSRARWFRPARPPPVAGKSMIAKYGCLAAERGWPGGEVFLEPAQRGGLITAEMS
jgi:hypothetical protein